MTHPYIPLYIDDYEAATAHLTAEEDGVYNRLLRLCWRTPGCSIPNDPAWIARKIRLSAEDFDRVAKPVIEEFFKVQRGRLVQKRLKDEYDDISRKKTARKKAGSSGGRQKALNAKENLSSTASDLPAHTRAFPEPEPEPEELPPTPQGAKRRKPETPIPDGCPSTELINAMQAEAREAGANLDLRHEARQFRDWWQAKDGRNRDWDACWRTWARRAIAKAPKTAAAALAGRPAPAADDRWRRWLREFKRNGYWPSDDAGPRPGRPGCRAPAAILAEFGITPPASNDPKPDLFARGDAA